MKQFGPFVKATLLAFSLTVTGCKSSKGQLSEAPRPVSQEQKIRLNINSEPSRLDPRKARSLLDINLLKMFMEGITRVDSSGNPHNALASEITASADGMVYTITLKKTSWSNGDALKASDFVYTWRKTLNPTFPSDNAHQLFVIKNAEKIKKGELPSTLLGVEATNDLTLKISLEKRTPYFEKLLSMPIFFAVNPSVDQTNPKWCQKAETFVSNGPFVMDSWHHSDKIVAVKNNKYWDRNNVRLNRIEMVMVSDNTGLQMFENNELDWEGSPLSTIPLDSIQSLKENNLLESTPALSSYFIRINTQVSPLQNKEVRRALALAINRQEIAEHVSSDGIPATGIVPKSMGLSTGEYFKDGDTETAAAILSSALKEMGLVPEDLNSLTLTYVSSDRSHRLAQSVQQQWYEALGVMVQLRSLESNVYFDAISKQDYELSFGNWIADFDDPVNFLEIFHSKEAGTNKTGWERPDFQQALSESYQCANEADRIEKLRSAEKILLEDVPAIPLLSHSWMYVKNRHVHNMHILPDGSIDLKTAYIGEE